MNLEKILRGIIFTGIFSLPLIVFIVIDSTFFPYIVGKNITFRVLVEVMFGSWVLLALLNESYRPRWTVLLIAVTAFVGVVALADFLGENPFKSIWSNFERMDGLVTLVHLLAYFVVAGTVVATENVWLWLWRVSLTISGFVSIYALVQLVTTEKTRLDSTLGNPIYLAVYALFNIFIALILLARRRAVRWEQVFYLLLLPLLGTVLFLTATRGATLGLIGGIALAAVGTAFSLHNNKKVKLTAIGIIALILLGIASFWVARDTSFVQESPVLQRFTTLSLSDGTVYARTLVWGMAWEGVKERPLLGWGQENFNFVFNTHYDPRMYGQEQWFDRTHNVVFDWLIAAGVLGLLAYISIFLALLWTLYKTENFTLIQKWLLFGLLAAYGFHNLTVFDNIISYLLFFTVIAWVYSTADDVWECRVSHGINRVMSEKTALYIGVPVVVIITGLLLWSINLVPLQVSKDLLNGLRAVYTAQFQAEKGDINDAIANTDTRLEFFKKVAARNTLGIQEVREQWAESAGKLVSTTWLPNDNKNKWYAQAAEALREQQASVPNDARIVILLANLHQKAGNFKEAEREFLRALELSPTKQTILLALSVLYINNGDNENALVYAKQAFELDQTFANARVLYSIMLVHSGEVEAAVALVKEDTHAAEDGRIITTLVQTGFYSDARTVWELDIVDNATFANQERLLALISVYVNRGDFARAKSEAMYIREIYPETAALMEQVLKEIQKLSQS